jgi:mannobiose 2-epimerase
MSKIDTLREEMLSDLTENILPFWSTKAVDNLNGGFYGEILKDGTVVDSAAKSLILNARILWTFSSAYRVLKNDLYLEFAGRAFDYLVTNFIDAENGGGYYMLNADGTVSDRSKFTYAQGFTLYAFSEYYRATGLEAAKIQADAAFDYIERNCITADGYSEFAAGDPSGDSEFGKMFTMNNHLHILEPVTNYFRIEHSAGVENSLVNLIEIFLDKIYNPDAKHFDLFFKDDWTPVTTSNSYGHDIEGSWLICEAAEVLSEFAKDKTRTKDLLERSKIVALEMAEAVLNEGLDPATGAVYDGGDRNGNITEPKRVWWAQAEGIVGFFNAYQITNNEKYFNAAVKIREYIDAQVIDHEFGEWFGTAGDSPEDENSNYKVNAWKCPYHNSRAALEIFERTK